MGRLRFSPAAAHDLQKPSEDIAAAAGERVALTFVARLRYSLERLADFPRMGRHRRALGPDVRSWAFSPYVAFYRETDSGVEIIRLLHGRRRITRSLLGGR
jgi:toxin ParE1/3/4